MTSIIYAVFKEEKGWLVRSLAGDGDDYGDYVTHFKGDNAEARAKEYSTWKNVFSGGSKNGVNAGAYAR